MACRPRADRWARLVPWSPTACCTWNRATSAWSAANRAICCWLWAFPGSNCMKESKVTSIGLLLAFACTAQAQSRCDAACLSVTMNDYLAKTTGHRASEIRVSRDALIYFNTHAGRLDENPLGRARTIISAQIFADPESGNVMARTGLELEDRKI